MDYDALIKEAQAKQQVLANQLIAISGEIQRLDGEIRLLQRLKEQEQEVKDVQH